MVPILEYGCKVTKNILNTKYFLQKKCIFYQKKHFFRIFILFLCGYSIKK